MKVIDFSECNNRDYWLEQIAKTDWRSGKYLCELLKSNLFHEKAGIWAKVLLLVDDDCLLAFCTVSEKKYDIDFNVLTVLTSKLAKYPKELFNFYIKNKFKYIQLIPCLYFSRISWKTLFKFFDTICGKDCIRVWI